LNTEKWKKGKQRSKRIIKKEKDYGIKLQNMGSTFDPAPAISS